MAKTIPSEEELLGLLKRIVSENPNFVQCRVYIEAKSRKKDWKITEIQVDEVLKKYNLLVLHQTKIPDIPEIDKDNYIAFFTDDKEEVPVIKDTGSSDQLKSETPKSNNNNNATAQTQPATTGSKKQGKGAKAQAPKNTAPSPAPSTTEKTPSSTKITTAATATTATTATTKTTDAKAPEETFPFVRLVATKVPIEEQLKMQEELLKQTQNGAHTPLFTADEIAHTFTISNMPEKTRQEFEKARKQYKDFNVEGASIFAENMSVNDDEKIKEHLNGLDDLSDPEQMNEFLKRTMFDTVTSLGLPVIHRRKDGSVHFIPGKN